MRFLNFAIWPSANYWLNNSYLWKFIILHLDLISMSHLYAHWNCYHKIVYDTTTSINLLYINLNLHHPLFTSKNICYYKKTSVALIMPNIKLLNWRKTFYNFDTSDIYLFDNTINNIMSNFILHDETVACDESDHL